MTRTDPAEPLHQQEAPAASTKATFHDPSSPDVQVSVYDLFGPGFRDGVLEMDYMLRTKVPKSMYRRDFVYLSRLLHAMDRYRGIRSADPVRLDEQETKVAHKLDNVSKLIKKRAKEGQALLEVHKTEAATITYPRAARYRAPIISPYAREFMEILTAADSVFADLEMLFLLGAIDRKQRGVIEFEVRRACRAISAVVRQVRVETLKYIEGLKHQANEAEQQEITEIASTEAATLKQEGSMDMETTTEISYQATLERIAGDAVPLPAPDSMTIDKAPSAQEVPQAA